MNRKFLSMTLVCAAALGLVACGSDETAVDVESQKDAIVDELYALAVEGLEAAGTPEEEREEELPKIRSAYECMIDETYDDLSQEAIDGLLNGETPEMLPEQDYVLLDEAAKDCAHLAQ